MRSVRLSNSSKIAMGCVAVLAFQFLLLYPLHTSMDLPMADESYYMGWGSRFASGTGTLGDTSSSPFYVLLYSVFVRSFGAIGSIFLMKYFLTMSVSVAVFVFLMRNLRTYPISILLSFVWAVSTYNVNADIIVYHFGVLVFLLALIYCNTNKMVSVILLLLCSFVRLEYILVLVPYVVYLSVLFIRHRKIENLLPSHVRSRRILSSATIVILLALLIYVSINVDGWNLGTDRTWFAFRQHYALSQVRAGQCDLDPWIDYNVLIDRDFPSSNSVFDAFLVNPAPVFRHVLRNLLNLPKAILKSVFPVRALTYYLIICVGFLLYTFAILIFFRRWRRFAVRARNVKSRLGDIRVLSIFSLLALAPSLIVYAKDRYSVVLMPFILLYSGVLYVALLEASDRKSFLKAGLYYLICIIVVVCLIGPRPLAYRDGKRPIYEKVVRLQEIWPRTKTKLLGLWSTTYANYIGLDKCIPIEPLATAVGGDIRPGGVSLRDLLLSHDPDAVLISQRLLASKNFDENSIKVLNSEAWTAYDIGDEKLYLKKQIRNSNP